MKNTKTILIYLVTILLTSCKTEKKETPEVTYSTELIQRVRAAASAIPGSLPEKISYLKYAESIRKWNTVVEGGGDDPAKMARTAFQVHYPDGWVMIDAGMDKAIHHFFEKDGPQPFDQAKADSVKLAVAAAKLILITHEHGDHVGGVIRVAATGPVPRKTVLTRQQVNALIEKPQMEELKLTKETSRNYIIADFEDILPIAPGIVIIKAPGHTPGAIMVYTRLANGVEYLFTGDVTWSYKGIAEKRQKPKSERKRVGEDEDLIEKQINWINHLMVNEKVTVLVSHDDIMIPQFAANGLLEQGIRTTL